ncbi:MAG: alpha-mannosidase [Calditrichaeota bacterium]|nr:alpha-mannosidase [Calditrichota bacterium]
MPRFYQYTVNQLDQILEQIREKMYTEIAPLEIRGWRSKEPLPYAQRSEGEEEVFRLGDKWGDLFDCAWFHFTGRVPASAAGEKIVLLLDVNGEMCIFDENGVPVRGLTNVSSGFDDRLGGPGKRVLQFSERANGGEIVAVWADAACNDLFGFVKENGTIKQAAIAVCNDEARALFYDFEVLLDLMKVTPEDSARRQRILRALNLAANIFAAGDENYLTRARAELSGELLKKGGDPSLKISAVGHAHLDLAWLWPVRETIRKGARTFSTALELMERYPDYIYGASQPQLYEWMKIHYPTLYEKIKQKVAAGRIEPLGASWVEFDTNLPGGEAIVRQLLFGKKFFKAEFGVEIDHLWQPDVFGYTAALPQILEKAGVHYFMTQKLSWSLINVFPHHSFIWEGIDGTSVLTHMLPEETYNSQASPFAIKKIEKNYKDKDVSEEALLVFGIGDGGGGPGAEHLERLQRMKNLAGLPTVTQRRAQDFFASWKKDAANFARWVGELYLERHQGTFTTNARNKWYNRKMEIALREAEWACSLARKVVGGEYPQEKLEKIWKETLLYQFHDILPGSSIKRVYDESLARYEKLLEETRKITEEAYRSLAKKVNAGGSVKAAVIFNSLSWQRTEWVKFGNNWRQVTVPALGYIVEDFSGGAAISDEVNLSENSIENDLLRLRFAEDGTIDSIFDKEFGREIVPENEQANQLLLYHDDGDAWDIPLNYRDIPPRKMQLEKSEMAVDGPKVSLKQLFRLGNSTLEQEIVLFEGSRRIDFKTKLNWREIKSMLRVQFPVNVHAEEAAYEIQFGHYFRPTHQNTSWDLAKDEVPAQKWADLSQDDYGVALLNDSKYGYRVKGNVLELNLLRSVPYPGQAVVKDEDVKPGEAHHAYTDQREHEFVYSLFPHPGNHRTGGVNKAAYGLNVPLQIFAAENENGDLTGQNSFFELDSPDVIIEAVKKAEDDAGTILRLCEAENQNERVKLKIALPFEKIFETDLTENVIREISASDEGIVEIDFQPFEIKTLKIL